MTAKEEKKSAWQAVKLWLANQIAAPLVLKAVIAIATAIVAIATTIVGGWGAVGKVIAGLLGYRALVPVWLLALMIVALVGFVVRLIIYRLRERRKPEWLQYTEGEFFDMKWCWCVDANKKISGLSCFCPNDQTRLVYVELEDDVVWDAPKKTKYFCDTCKKEWGPFPGRESVTRGRVEVQIERNIRTEEWKTSDTETTE